MSRRSWIVVAPLLALIALGAVLQLAAPAGDEAATVRRALADPTVRSAIGPRGYTSVSVSERDKHNRTVSFFRGQRFVADAIVSDRAGVTKAQRFGPGGISTGGSTAGLAWVTLLSLALVMAAIAPARLRTARTADAAAVGTIGLGMLLMDRLLLLPGLALAYAASAYLAARLFALAWRSAPPEEVPGFFERVPGRYARYLLAATVIAALLITLTSDGLVDVPYASLAGATQMLEGRLPYGHIEGAFHGDTYPLLAYAWYLPAALVHRVHDPFDNIDISLVVSALALVAGALGIRRAARSDAATTTGLVIAWFAYPAVLRTAASGMNDVIVAALLAWAMATAWSPVRSGALLAVAAWTKVTPVVLLPVWLARLRGRSVAHAAAAVAAVTAVCALVLIAYDGTGGISAMIDGLSFQLGRTSQHSLWVLTGLQSARPAALAGLVVLLCVATLHAWRRGLDDPRRLAAVSAGLLIVVQLCGAYWSAAYAAWWFPLALLALFTHRVAR